MVRNKKPFYLDKFIMYDILMLIKKLVQTYDSIDSLNLGERGGGGPNSPKLSRCGVIVNAAKKYIEELGTTDAQCDKSSNFEIY